MDGYELLAKIRDLLNEIIEVPNSWLPEEFRDDRTTGVSLRELEEKCDARDRAESESDHAIEKAEKARRVQLYAEQIASGQEIAYLPK